MSDTPAYLTMRELLRAIDQRLGDLDNGRLRVDGLEALTEDSRQLYERLVVLRHQALLRQMQGGEGASAIVAAEPQPIRLDTKPRQISLIDAIQESEPTAPSHTEPAGPERSRGAEVRPPSSSTAETPAKATRPSHTEPVEVRPQSPSTGEAPAKVAQPATVASRLEQAPIADLGKAIAISQKFWFINELFGRDASAYETAIKRINTSGGVEEARAFIHTEVVTKLKKAPEEEALTTFMELVERRFKA
ncbi:MAG: hypothetical protein JNM31_02730 [Flavobacteriales bacterium]|nr:hypothetical protein [Flavobacteriales bacterium]